MANIYGHSLAMFLSGLLLSHNCTADETPVEPKNNQEFWLWFSHYADAQGTVFDPLDLEVIEQKSADVNAKFSADENLDSKPQSTPINEISPNATREATQ